MSKAALTKFLGLLLEVAVTAGLLTFVLHDAHKREQMAAALRSADWRWLVAGVAVYGAVEVLALVRWKMLLHIQHFRIGWREAAGILFIGEFFLTFTPGMVGGDAMRIYYLLRNDAGKKVDAFTTVLMDRIMGMLALITLATIVLSLRYHWLSQSAVGAGLVRAVVIILGMGAAALVASLVIARSGALAHRAVPQKLRELGTAFGQFALDWRRTLAAFATTLLSHVCYYTSFCFAACALNHTVRSASLFHDVFSIMPIENTLTALPISFAGIGLRESLFQSLLHDLSGVDPAVGALIGAIGFATKALWSLPGAVVWMGYGLSRKTPAAEPVTQGAVEVAERTTKLSVPSASPGTS